MGAAAVRIHLENLIALANLLERVDANPLEIGADQYRTLVRQVQGLLDDGLPDDAVQAVLRKYPATAVLYENLHYEQAGLSRSSLDLSVSTDMLASKLLHKVAGGRVSGR